MQNHCQRHADGHARDALHDVAGNTGSCRQSLAQNQGGVEEVAHHHDDLAYGSADQQGGLTPTHGPEDQRRRQGIHALDNQGAGGIVGVADPLPAQRWLQNP